MSSSLEVLTKNPALEILNGCLANYSQEVYLVGGVLRDAFIQSSRPKTVYDFDFAVSSDSIKIARAVAHKLKSGFVVLDKEHGSARIVFKKGDLVCNFDFTDFRGKDIIDDLQHRDFTVNALALDLRRIKEGVNLSKLILDPCKGRKDLQKKIIRVISKNSFPEDPLRILRVFTLNAVQGFKIDPTTLAQIKRHKSKIITSAFERITEELFKIFNSSRAYLVVCLMGELRILDEIIPQVKIMRGVKQGPYHHLDVYDHSLETLRRIEIVFSQVQDEKDIQDYLNQVISGVHTRRALFKLGALLHDVGKPETLEHFKGKTRFHGHEKRGKEIAREIVERLRLSNDERYSLSRIIFWHLRPGYLADMKMVSRRAIFRFFRDAQGDAPAILLLSIADQRSTRGPLTRGANRKHHEETCLGLIKEFFAKSKEKKVKRLINGNDLMRHLKLPPGPVIGEILEKVEEAQGIGLITTKKDALALADKVFKKTKK